MASISCNSGAYTIVGSASITNWQLSIASGSYGVTGTAAGTIHGYQVIAISGVYTITGTAIQSRRIAAEPAGYILNGQPVTLTKSNKYVFAANSGSYSISGIAAITEKAIPYTKGTYAITGTAASLIRSSAAFKIIINSGSYVITGTAASLLSTVKIESGDYRLTGTVATLKKGKSILALSGGYTLSGFPSTKLAQSRHFPSAVGSYTITGFLVTLRYSNATAIFLVANASNYTITGQTANLLMARRIVANPGSYVISDGHTVFTKQYDSGIYDITGTDASLVVGNRRLTATAGSYSVSGVAVSLIYSIRRLVVDSGTYNIAGLVTDIRASRVIAAQVGQYIETGTDATLRATRIILESGQYVLTGGPANLTSTHRRRWKPQKPRPSSGIPQPVQTNTWTPQESSPGV